MTDPVFFTVVADYRSVVADLTTDIDDDPQITPISAVVTFRPVLREGDAILAVDASPRPIGYVPAPIVAKLNTQGRLVLRDVPDGTRVNVATFDDLPGDGSDSVYYVVAETGKYYRWNGLGYLEILPYQPVRLLADTPLLELDSPLHYSVSFSQVVMNGRASKLNGFTFQAPTSDIPGGLNLIEVMRQPGQPASGITKIAPGAVRSENGNLVFSFGGVDIPDPIPIDDVTISDDLYAESLIDSGPVGRNLVRADTINDALRNVLNLPTYEAAAYGVQAGGTNNVANLLDCLADASVTGGTVILPAGVLNFDADLGPVVADSGNAYVNRGGAPLPVDTPIRVMGQGVGATVWRMSAGFRRGFDLPYIEPGQVYRDIEISGITFDRNNIDPDDILPLTTITQQVTLTNGQWVTIPGLSANACKNVTTLRMPKTNSGTAKEIYVPCRIVGNAVQVNNYSWGGTKILEPGDQVGAQLFDHVILGVSNGSGIFQNNGWDMDFRRITLRDCEAVNVVTWPHNGHTPDGLASNSTIIDLRHYGMTRPVLTEDILIENVRMDGGGSGVWIGSNGASINGHTQHVDRVWLRNLYHNPNTENADQTWSWQGVNYLVGGSSTVGVGGAINCEGHNSSDVGLEVDQPWRWVQQGCRWVNTRNFGCYRTTFVPPAETSAGPPNTTTTESINASATSVTVAAVPAGVDPAGIALLGTEQVWYVATGTTLALTRGLNGTTAATHSSGARLTFVQTSKTRYVVRDDLIINPRRAAIGSLNGNSANLPKPPAFLDSVSINAKGGTYEFGSAIWWEGYCPETVINDLRYHHTGIQGTSSSGFAVGFQCPSGAADAVVLPAPVIRGRRNKLVVSGSTSNSALRFAGFRMPSGAVQFDLDMDVDLTITGGSANTLFGVELASDSTSLVAAGSRLGITAKLVGNANPAALRLTAQPSIEKALDVDLDVSGLEFTASTGDTNYRPYVADSSHNGKLRVRTIKHSRQATIAYPSEKRLAVPVTSATYNVRSDDDLLLVDTTSNAVTINLPKSAAAASTGIGRLSDGHQITIVDVAGAANPIIVKPQDDDSIDNLPLFATQRITSGGTHVYTAHPAANRWVSDGNLTASRQVCQTAIGGTGTEDGAGTWAKLATISTTANFATANLLLAVTSDRNTLTPKSDVALVSLHYNLTTTPYGALRVLTPATTSFGIDAFKLIGDASSAELWVKKNITFGVIRVVEVASGVTSSAAVLYTRNAGWQSATPTGSTLNVVSTGITQDDIPDGTTNKAFTASDQSRLANTSGTNTGDQTTISGNAGTATKLETARTVQTDLASTSSASFDGSANISPGITGILPVANGGTGASDLAAFLLKNPAKTSTTASGGTLTLTGTATPVQVFTGGSAHTVKLPSTGIVAGQQFHIINNSSGIVTVQGADGSSLIGLTGSRVATFTARQDEPPSTQWAITGYTSSSGASTDTAAIRDSRANLLANNFVATRTAVTTTGGTTALTIASSRVQQFSGTSTHTVTLPTTSVTAGYMHVLINNSTQTVTVNASGGATVTTVAASSVKTVTAMVDTPTLAGDWWAA